MKKIALLITISVWLLLTSNSVDIWSYKKSLFVWDLCYKPIPENLQWYKEVIISTCDIFHLDSEVIKNAQFLWQYNQVTYIIDDSLLDNSNYESMVKLPWFPNELYNMLRDLFGKWALSSYGLTEHKFDKINIFYNSKECKLFDTIELFRDSYKDLESPEKIMYELNADEVSINIPIQNFGCYVNLSKHIRKSLKLTTKSY